MGPVAITRNPHPQTAPRMTHKKSPECIRERGSSHGYDEVGTGPDPRFPTPTTTSLLVAVELAAAAIRGTGGIGVHVSSATVRDQEWVAAAIRRQAVAPSTTTILLLPDPITATTTAAATTTAGTIWVAVEAADSGDEADTGVDGDSTTTVAVAVAAATTTDSMRTTGGVAGHSGAAILVRDGSRPVVAAIQVRGDSSRTILTTLTPSPCRTTHRHTLPAPPFGRFNLSVPLPVLSFLTDAELL